MGKSLNLEAAEQDLAYVNEMIEEFEAEDRIHLVMILEKEKDWLEKEIERLRETPVGYANLYVSGHGNVYPTTEEAEALSNHAKETAVALYRHPAPAPVVDAEPVGYANLSQYGNWSKPAKSVEKAKKLAENEREMFMLEFPEIAVPLYRHPAPAAKPVGYVATHSNGDLYINHLFNDPDQVQSLAKQGLIAKPLYDHPAPASSDRRKEMR